MKYYIGIDGGGTKSDCILADENNYIINSVRGGALNLFNLGPAESAITIQQIISSCLLSSNIKLSQITGIGIGAAGAGQLEDAIELEKILTQLYPVGIKIKVVSDAEAALEGAFTGKPGCILIAGTGSIIYGKDDNCNIYRCGGYGKLLGDQGSGYSIGRKGLTAVIKQYDQSGKHTAITRLLFEKFGISSFKKVIHSVYKESFDVASVAPLVIEAAAMNDSVAIEIIDEETDSLIELISYMAGKLKKNSINIVFIGTLIATENYYSSVLKKKIENSNKVITIKLAEYPPAMGAIFTLNKMTAEIN